MSQKFKNDIRISLKVVWILLSVVTTIILLMSVYYPEALLSSAPVCLSKTYNNTECFMCGMTRAFNYISTGNLSHAIKLNEMSLALYLIFAVNTIAFFYILVLKAGRIFIKFKKPLTALSNKN